MKFFKLFFILLVTNLNFSQEIDGKIIVNSDFINQTNKSVFNNLEKSISNFINLNSWAENKMLDFEKIDLNLLITITSYSDNKFIANFEFQSLRPIFNSTYQTPIFNFVEKNFQFEYIEFEPLFYTENLFQSNLASLLSFYINIVLGVDSDSYVKDSGKFFYNKSQETLNLANQSAGKGWGSSDSGGRINKYWLIENLNSSNSKEFKDMLYEYHVNGLDLMHENILLSKKNISNSINSLERMNRRVPNSILLRIFFETKSDEIVDVFSSGPDYNTEILFNRLNKIAPFFSNKWFKITNERINY
ncbi:MAG: type IX secretion system protein PorD [Flavobacteriales bacterium]|tara:strand:- start:21343 stop:22251 length:909 start_codon:yes stop_codon:yes gene_type:complete